MTGDDLLFVLQEISGQLGEINSTLESIVEVLSEFRHSERLPGVPEEPGEVG
jgi:hypothetical protein